MELDAVVDVAEEEEKDTRRQRDIFVGRHPASQ
jgi:hypothetical protein